MFFDTQGPLELHLNWVLSHMLSAGNIIVNIVAIDYEKKTTLKQGCLKEITNTHSTIYM
jgi:hypothetical protein